MRIPWARSCATLALRWRAERRRGAFHDEAKTARIDRRRHKGRRPRRHAPICRRRVQRLGVCPATSGEALTVEPRTRLGGRHYRRRRHPDGTARCHQTRTDLRADAVSAISRRGRSVAGRNRHQPDRGEKSDRHARRGVQAQGLFDCRHKLDCGAAGSPKNASLGYHVAKAGIGQIVRYYAVALGRRGVRVNSITPASFSKRKRASTPCRTKSLFGC